MAIIPMRQQITVTRGGGVDDWGNPTEPTVFTIKCRIDEGSRLSKTLGQGLTRDGGVAIADARIFIDKLADIKYDDVISFTNELGETIERNPREINVKRHVSGKPLMTEVLV